MTLPSATPEGEQKLRASPSFALSFTMDGRAYVAKEVEPYIQYWLNDQYRVLLSLFSGRHGLTVNQALAAYGRLCQSEVSPALEKRLRKAIGDMHETGVLVDPGDDISRYHARMAQDYLTHRPFPPELARIIIDAGSIQADSRVLDLAGGPGNLTLALAQASRDVTLMELSRGFVNAARKEAKRIGVHLTPLHESCNRLVFHDEQYDVVTVSQALHWLDDVLVCRGLCRVLRNGGSFLVVHSSIDLDDSHPLSYLLGNKSILGSKLKAPFYAQVEALERRLSLLFDALDAPDVHRVDLAQQWATADGQAPQRIVSASTALFRQRRPFGLGFARAFVTSQHIAPTGLDPTAFWRDLEQRCASSTALQRLGAQDWAVLHFKRGATRTAPLSLQDRPVTELGWSGPPDP